MFLIINREEFNSSRYSPFAEDFCIYSDQQRSLRLPIWRRFDRSEAVDSFLAEKAADSQIARQILELHARCFCDSESPLITPRVESNLHPTQNPEKKDGGRLARSIKISKFSASDFYIIIIFSGKKYSALSPFCIFNNSQRKLISWSALSLIYSYKYVWGAKKSKIWVYPIG